MSRPDIGRAKFLVGLVGAQTKQPLTPTDHAERQVGNHQTGTLLYYGAYICVFSIQKFNLGEYIKSFKGDQFATK